MGQLRSGRGRVGVSTRIVLLERLERSNITCCLKRASEAGLVKTVWKKKTSTPLGLLLLELSLQVVFQSLWFLSAI